jgi:hypothetical protein
MSGAERFAAVALVLGLASGCATMTPEPAAGGRGGLCKGVQRAAGVDKGGSLQGAMRGAWLGTQVGAQSAAHCGQDSVCQAMVLGATVVGAVCGLTHGMGEGAASAHPVRNER